MAGDFFARKGNKRSVFADFLQISRPIPNLNKMMQTLSPSEQFDHILAQEAHATSHLEQLAIVRAYDQLLRQYPDMAAAYQNRSALLQQLGLYELAWRDALKVEQLAPDFALGHCNKAFLLNLFGRYAEGWAEYEWRWKTDVPTFSDKGWPIPRWQGEAIEAGKKLLVHAEQGFGDNIQFVRFAIEAKQRGVDLVVINHSPVENLLNYNLAHYGVETAKNGSSLGNLQAHCAMMSFPHLLGTTLDTIPFSQGYLQAEPEFFAKFQQKVTACCPSKRLKIGVVWAGSPKHNRDKIRSLQFAQFARLFALNADFHCLQKTVSEADLAFGKRFANLHFWYDELQDFSDTAGLVAQMDLIISVDTSVAHLAAAMGKPTWILLTFHPDFRWLLGRNDSPWYQSVRLYRQDFAREWHAVIEQIQRDLATFIQEQHNV